MRQLGATGVPDFLVHSPGDMNHNLVVVEVKAVDRIGIGNLATDLDKLTKFTTFGEGEYELGIYLVYGGTEESFDSVRALARRWVQEKPGERSTEFGSSDTESPGRPGSSSSGDESSEPPSATWPVFFESDRKVRGLPGGLVRRSQERLTTPVAALRLAVPPLHHPAAVDGLHVLPDSALVPPEPAVAPAAISKIDPSPSHQSASWNPGTSAVYQH